MTSFSSHHHMHTHTHTSATLQLLLTLDTYQSWLRYVLSLNNSLRTSESLKLQNTVCRHAVTPAITQLPSSAFRRHNTLTWRHLQNRTLFYLGFFLLLLFFWKRRKIQDGNTSAFKSRRLSMEAQGVCQEGQSAKQTQ